MTDSDSAIRGAGGSGVGRRMDGGYLRLGGGVIHTVCERSQMVWLPVSRGL